MKAGKKSFLIFLVVLALGLCVFFFDEILIRQKINRHLSSVSFRTFSGNEYDIPIYEKKMFLFFWSLKNKASLKQLTYLQECMNKSKFKSQNVYAINVDADVSAVAQYIDKNEISLPILLDPQMKYIQLTGSDQIPAFYVQNKKAVITWASAHFGFFEPNELSNHH